MLKIPSLEEIGETLNSLNIFYENYLGYFPKETTLEIIPNKNWKDFTIEGNINPKSSGLYLPRNQTAILKGENLLSLFHEYFGHGLYCEQNLSGIKLVELEKKLLEEEKMYFQNKKFTLDELKEFRLNNQTFMNLKNFQERNLGSYELFAIWTEYFLSEKMNLKNSFEKKYDALDKKNKDSINSFISFNKKYGSLATFYEQGMARITTSERTRNLLEEMFSDELKKSKLILLTGSKKPFSDIDLFASSNYLKNIQSDWIDLVSFDEEDFENRVRLFEVQVTHPIMSGELVFGDEDYLKKIQKQLLEQPITEEAINHNFEKSEEQKRFSLNKEFNEKQKEIHKNYSKTYLVNAILLGKGIRKFTKEDLLLFSHNERNIKLKGGINL